LALDSCRGSAAASFPTLISYATGVFGLLAGPSARFSRDGLLGEASSPNRPPLATVNRSDVAEISPQSSSDLRGLPEDGHPFWRCVGPGLRVLPLTPQVTFTLQSGDPVFRPPEAGGFVRPCRIGPTPRPGIPFCAFPIASRNLSVRLAHQGSPRRAGPSSYPDPIGHWVRFPGRNHGP
jgi:hypothetical protein